MNCLVVDAIDTVLIEELEQAGIRVEYQPGFDLATMPGPDNLTTVLVIRSKFHIGPAELDRFPSLRLIARAGAGLDILDEAACHSRGIAVVHAAEGNADAVAEHTLGLMLGLLNRIPAADRSVRRGEWDREGFRGLELMGRTVGLLGYGNMGTAVAERLLAFGCRVLAYDKYRHSWPEKRVEKTNLAAFFEQVQILSIHLPLTPETQGMADAEFLRNFRKGLFLINTARGQIVPLGGLVQLLAEGHVAGAALDVMEIEPPAKYPLDEDSPVRRLAEMDQVILTPHVAGWSAESYRKISLVLSAKIRGWAASARGEQNFKTE